MRNRNTIKKGGKKINKSIKRGGKKNRKFQKMNCNPAIKGESVSEDSCFTNHGIHVLKDSYNKHHKDSQILSNNSVEIWGLLKTKLYTCDKEDCWLKEIEDVNTRDQLEEYLFAPKQPKEWKKNPNEWLSNIDITNVLKQYEDAYSNFKAVGPTPIDFDTRPKEMNGECVWEELCTFNLENYIKTGKTKLGIVFNLDKHNQGGSHWVSLYVDLDDEYIFYMDSAGNKIPKEIDTLVKKIIGQGVQLKKKLNIHFYENCPLEHQMGNTECGMYTLYFLITMLTNETVRTKPKKEKKTFKNYIEKIEFFKDKRIPDDYVNEYRKIYFNE